MITSFVLFIIFSTSSAFSETVVDIISTPIEPFVICMENNKSDLAQRCVKDLCKDTKSSLPMIINNPKEFFDQYQYSVKPSVKEGFKVVIKERIKELNRILGELEKTDLSTTLSGEEKFAIISNAYRAKCIQMFSPDKKITATCDDPKLDNSPVKALYLSYIKEQVTNNWNDGLVMKFYTMDDFPKLMTPDWKTKIKSKLNELTDDHYQFISANLNDFEKLPPVDRIRFIKIVSLLQNEEQALSEDQIKVINKQFDELTKNQDFKKEITVVREKINSPIFYQTALASLETQDLLDKLAPDAEELIQFKKIERDIKDKILAFQNEQLKAGKMSEGSLKHYSEELEKVIFNYQGAAFTTGHIKPSSLPYFLAGKKEVIDILLHKQQGSLFDFVGAGLGSTIALVNDQYIDPLFRSLYDPNQGSSEVRFSLYSIKNPEFGKQILAHELGHHFSYLHMKGRLSEKTANEVKKSKECIVSRFEDKKAGELYLEEDFSDEWTFSLFKESDPVYFCPLLLESSESPMLSLELLKNVDLHSPVFWRALNQFMSKNSEAFPHSCNELIKNSPYQYKKCI